ncbi:MAG TPA: hypothetical protein VMZ91_01265 [Candidatus Paceibacterota bacterium]|nr:hypothetical protein [Candidatus Paceibacterota bacterium]
MNARESFNFWRALFGKYPSGKSQISRLFQKRFYTSKYFWHDSFGKFWNRLVKCRLFGHKNIQDIMTNSGLDKYCFDCETYLNMSKKEKKKCVEVFLHPK